MAVSLFMLSFWLMSLCSWHSIIEQNAVDWVWAGVTDDTTEVLGVFNVTFGIFAFELHRGCEVWILLLAMLQMALERVLMFLGEFIIADGKMVRIYSEKVSILLNNTQLSIF